jgi:hypothetical protein
VTFLRVGNRLLSFVVSAMLIAGCGSGGDGGGSTPPPSPPVSVTLTIAKDGTGTGTITSNPAGVNCGTTCTLTVTSGTVVTLTAAPAPNNTLADWGSACATASATCAVTVTANQTITATFNTSSANPSLGITLAGTGTVTSNPAGINCGTTCSASFNNGTSITLTATGAGFSGWIGGGCSGTGTCILTLTQNTTVTATFGTGLPSWAQARLEAYVKASNTGAFNKFGTSVALSGDTLAVGASEEESAATGVNGDQPNDSALASGAVYVFTRTGGVWSQQAYVKASNTGTNDDFGTSVALSGDILAVGAVVEASAVTGVNGDQANNSAPGSGAVYVFTRTGGVWSQQAYVKASNTGFGDRFGGSVALSGDTLAVGAKGEDSNAIGVAGDQTNNNASESGAVYVYRAK